MRLSREFYETIRPLMMPPEEPPRRQIGFGARLANHSMMDPALRLTRLSDLGNAVTLYGLQYSGFHGCVSWCYLTIGHGVIVATQPEHGDCGTSITNIWDEYFLRSLQSLPQVTGPDQQCVGSSTIMAPRIPKSMKCF
jgi:hypothetical protein